LIIDNFGGGEFCPQTITGNMRGFMAHIVTCHFSQAFSPRPEGWDCSDNSLETITDGLSRLYGYNLILSIRLGSWNYRVLRLAIAQIPALNEFIEFEA